MAQLICITGMDGTGKSTLMASLSESLPSSAVAAIWDIVDGAISTIPFASKKDIDAYLCELSPDSRALFIAHALKFSVDNALASGKKTVLLNGYYYKYFASEIALGASRELINKLESSLPLPDKIICLELPIKEAAARKQKFSRYECGLANKPDVESFIAFQTKVHEVWKEFKMPSWYFLNSNLSAEVLWEKSNQIIGL